MQEQHPYYTTTMLPELAYPGVDVAIPMLTVHNWMLGMDSLDDEVVTILLNILADDRVSLEQVHVMAEQIDLDRLSDAPIPLHSATQSWTSSRSVYVGQRRRFVRWFKRGVVWRYYRPIWSPTTSARGL